MSYADSVSAMGSWINYHGSDDHLPFGSLYIEPDLTHQVIQLHRQMERVVCGGKKT